MRQTQNHSARPAPNDRVPVVIRMPAELRDAIKAKAAAEERTMAQEIRYALTLHVQGQPQ